ncbi:MAG TPA: hypothetical protein VHH11_14055 [Gammaproteobacteria bacterium]|nr:hypothetical protein [Gammaproteobacteria bacterium]
MSDHASTLHGLMVTDRLIRQVYAAYESHSPYQRLLVSYCPAMGEEEQFELILPYLDYRPAMGKEYPVMLPYLQMTGTHPNGLGRGPTLEIAFGRAIRSAIAAMDDVVSRASSDRDLLRPFDDLLANRSPSESR